MAAFELMLRVRPLVCLVVGCATGVFGAVLMDRAGQTSDTLAVVEAWSDAIYGQPNEAVLPVIAATGLPSMGATCSSDAIKGQVQLALLRYDAISRLASSTPQVQAQEQAQGQAIVRTRFAAQDAVERIERALACSPADGNVWLRHSLLVGSLDPLNSVTMGSMQRSLAYAPHEEWVVRERGAWARSLANSQGLLDAAFIAARDQEVLVRASGEEL